MPRSLLDILIREIVMGWVAAEDELISMIERSIYTLVSHCLKVADRSIESRCYGIVLFMILTYCTLETNYIGPV